ncbi:Fosmidomycin resistance protein [Devosia epidermidihirudinis]|uniref:Fosmidomycin resistance protein n=1 Tax=Devosia epidermidihirudinis TaxID=1293439 RepID=A0A0F5QF44_9HYPH|nr:MFS transporter [Devosia epidermidihirudinis]KKC39560.1 Fosmidomycin resistance protein [Devosia epidermidihirudinis]
MVAVSSKAAPAVQRTSLAVLFAVSASHLLNDLMQFLLPALYPLLKDAYGLDYVQIGLITLAQQMTASLLQPLVGYYTDKNPMPYALAISMVFALVGVILIATANNFGLLILAAMVGGIGSAIFHPEASRVSRLASGGKLGFAQSLFQVGGNLGTSIGPLVAAYFLLPRGQTSTAWFAIVALAALVLLTAVGRWYAAHQRANIGRPVAKVAKQVLTQKRLVISFLVIGALLLSKYVYISSITSYYTFFMIEKFSLSAEDSQLYLFLFLGAIAAGTLIGGPVGDRFGRLTVIWCSIVGALPFTLLLPHLDLFGTAVASVLVGLILSSAFSAIVVYAQELIPGKVGMVAGFVFGFAFGIGAIGAAVLGALADSIGIIAVFNICAFLPFLGFLTIFLPRAAELHPTQGEPA